MLTTLYELATPEEAQDAAETFERFLARQHAAEDERAVEALFREVGCRYDPRRVRAVLSGAAKNS